MTYNKDLGVRIEKAIDDLTGGNYLAKKMFGGVGYMINGNMACGVLCDQLIVRVGNDEYRDALNKRGVEEFLNNGRPMTGWVMVNNSLLSEKKDLRKWVSRGVDYVLTLPKKVINHIKD